MKKILLTILMLGFSATASADLIFVGSWNVHDGPVWFPNGSQPVGTAQDAAALLFGGSASDYAISTNGADVDQVNNSGWYSIWGGPPGIFAEDYLVDGNGNGRYDQPGDSSAWIRDWCFEGQCINYAFRIVPEPGTLALLGLGIAGMGLARRRKKAA